MADQQEHNSNTSKTGNDSYANAQSDARVPTDAGSSVETRGLAKDFSAYAELEFERRRLSLDDFDEKTFQEAVELVKKKLRV